MISTYELISRIFLNVFNVFNVFTDRKKKLYKIDQFQKEKY